MDVINMVSTKQRNDDVYSSQKHLIEDDLSIEDDIIEILAENDSVTYFNKAIDCDDIEKASKSPPEAIKKSHVIKNTLMVEETQIEMFSSSDIKDFTDTKPSHVIKKRAKKKKKADNVSAFKDNQSNLDSSDASYLTNTIEMTKFNNENEIVEMESNKSLEEQCNSPKIDDIEIDINDKSNIGSTLLKSNRSKRRKSKEKNESTTEMGNLESTKDTKQIKRDTKETNRYRIIGIHVLKCEMLRNHLFLHSPQVKITFFKMKSGELVSYEQKGIRKDSISTRSYEFYIKNNVTPEWDEIILLDNDLMERISVLTDLIIFFEIIDVKLRLKASDEKELESIAWAFIKPMPRDGVSNMNKKLQLQLYDIDGDNSSNIYKIWKAKMWKIYPSTLYVTIKSIKSKEISIINDIRFDIVKYMSKNVRKPQINPTRKEDHIDFDKRKSGEQIKIPNKIISTLNCGDGIVTMLKFSKCGNYLACSFKEDVKYNIKVYKVPEFEEIANLSHHEGLVYDICWNFASNQLISASADSSVIVWDITDPRKFIKQELTHSSFVYTAKYCNCNEEIIATGSYDKIIRIWTTEPACDDDIKKYILYEELDGHPGYVNAICFLDNNEMFFSGDSQGNIFKWAKGKNNWIRMMDIRIDEFKSIIINDLILFSGGQKMLVILRNRNPWSIDIATAAGVICYKDGNINKYQMRGCIAPCGTFIFVSGNMWLTSTGELFGAYDPKHYNYNSIMSIDFHPFYNLVAMSSGCKNSPVLVCVNRNTNPDNNLGLELFSTSLIINTIQPDNLTDEDKKNQRFKTTVKKIQNDIGLKERNSKNKQYKLWNLLRKMDIILNNARRNQSNKIQLDGALKDTTKMYITNEKANNRRLSIESSDNRTISIDLTDFHRRMQSMVIDNEAENSTDTSQTPENSQGTYTLENERPKENLRIFKKVKNEIDESSTLSNAESLDDDLNTYTISLDK